MFGVGTSKPLFTNARDPLVATLRDHQMGVWVVLAATSIPALMNRQRVGEPFSLRELLGECVRQLDLIFAVQVSRQSEIRAQIQASVRPLEHVGGIPVLMRIVMCP